VNNANFKLPIANSGRVGYRITERVTISCHPIPAGRGEMTATIVPLDCIDIVQINNAFIWSACRYLADTTVNDVHERKIEGKAKQCYELGELAARLSVLDSEAEPLHRIIR